MKFKLLLLWWIITLFWIFNYSNANSITFTKVWDWDYSPYTFEAFDWMTNSIDYSCSPDFPCWVRFDDWNFNECFSMMCYNWDCTTFTQYSCVNWQTYNIEVSGASEVPFLSITFSDWQISWWWSEWSVIVWWYWSLTPAISWLWESVSQLIPLVVYIWIGVLLAIIWFFAIRWLLNRLNWKINWYFSSKRG